MKKLYFVFRIDLKLDSRIVLKTDLRGMCLINPTLFFRLNLESGNFILYEEVDNINACKHSKIMQPILTLSRMNYF